MVVTLNIDLGELPDEPDELYTLASVVNVACGGHAGDDASMARACRLARASGAALMAHPSYPDVAGFGRRSLQLPAAELEESLVAQLTLLARIAKGEGGALVGVKPHGALYHDVAREPALAAVLLDAIVRVFSGPLALVGPPDGPLARAAQARGYGYLREGFADRGYQADGTLVPRSAAGALLTEPSLARAQALDLAQSGRFDTLCVHGDSPMALAVARAVREGLSAAGELI